VGLAGRYGLYQPGRSISYGAELDYRFGLIGVGMMQITLGLVNATDDNLSKVLPGLDGAAKNTS